ncbi:MAG TPA: glycoside hydrolase family 31 protein [bacterium]|nr:glycoside hydrolase family 31 protein [bacterium]HPN46153.1 glycoside hydrolase family 31 protein [bacterium]
MYRWLLNFLLLLFIILLIITDVRAALPEADFTADLSTGYIPLCVQFHDLSGQDITEWTWDFGDNTTPSALQNPAHVYTRAGVYSVKLTVKSSGGFNTITKTALITAQQRTALPIPPAWVYEPWVWEDGGNTETHVRNLVQGYLDRDIPVGAVIIDSPWETEYNTFLFDSTLYPNAQGLINDLHAQNIRVIAWITSLINYRGLEGYGKGKAENYDYALQQNYFINNGQTYEWWKGWGSFIDYTNPNALQWWHGQMDQALDLGLDGWKTDAGCRSFPDTTKCFNGLVTRKEYSHLYYQDFYEYSRKKNGDQAIIFAKPYDEDQRDSMYVPVNYTPTTFMGDQLHDWSNKGFINALENIFMSAEKRFVAVGSDIGGYMGETAITKNLLLRWAQFGALCPIMENGGHGEHRPWMFDDQTVTIYRYFAKLHSQLVPYFYSYGVQAHDTGIPILRPATGDWQYRLGEELFVSPIYEDTDSRSVTLPSGDDWIDYWDDDLVYSGGATLANYDCPLSKYPIFIKSGAIIPMAVKDNSTGHGSAASAGKITVLVYPDGISAFTLYRDTQPVLIRCDADDAITRLTVAACTEEFIFRIRQFAHPFTIKINSINIPELKTFSDFENALSGWYYDVDKDYTWIKLSADGQATEIIITPHSTAAFTAVPVSGQAPLTVHFTDRSIYADTWQWDFGDHSALSNSQNPQHVYTNPGLYSVKLLVTGPTGSDSLLVYNYIQVGSAGSGFTDITETAGCKIQAPGYGQGVTFGDADLDGKIDLFVANAGSGYLNDLLYMNTGNNSFTSQATARGVNDYGHTHTILLADFDNDGDPDAYYTNQPVGSNRTIGANKMYRNDGNGYFTDITTSAGIIRDFKYSRCAIAADFNLDGWMDLYEGNSESPNIMYLNDGAGNMLRVHLGADGPSGDASEKSSITTADVDNDGDVDIYVCRNEAANWLFINDGEGRFTEEAAARGVALTARSRGAAFCDIDRDGDPDLFVAKYSSSGASLPLLSVYMNRGDGTFYDRSEEYNIRTSAYSIIFGDADNDTDPDMFLIRNNKKESDARPQLYMNDGSGQFTCYHYSGLEVPGIDARGAALADIDDDGDLDLFVTCAEGQNYLLRNDLQNSNHYIDILCIGPGGDYGGYGTRVFVYEPGYYNQTGHLLSYQESVSAMGYMSRSQEALHFGLGQFISCDIKVILSGGRVLELRGAPADQLLRVGGPQTELQVPQMLRPLVTGNNLQLSWLPVTGAEFYHVYRDTLAFFTPNPPGNRIAAQVTDGNPAAPGVQWMDNTSGVANAKLNYFYVVTAVRGGMESGPSTPAGEFDYPLITGETTAYNSLAMPVDSSMVTTAAGLLAAIPGCNSAAHWLAAAQNYQQYVPQVVVSNFPVQPGNGYLVNVQSNSMFSVAGFPALPFYHLITTEKTNFNEIMLPLDKTGITRASQLLAAIPGCNSVARWSAADQGYAQYLPELEFSDFPVRAGYPYLVNVTRQITWPDTTTNRQVVKAAQPIMAGNGETQAPHIVYGDIPAGVDDRAVTFTAIIAGKNNLEFKPGMPGCSIHNGKWVVQLGGPHKSWKPGALMRVEFFDDRHNLLGTAQCVLTGNPADYAGSGENIAIVTEFELLQNYPNPFNPVTTIKYGLPRQAHVELVITDMLGRTVKKLVSARQNAGWHTLEWDGADERGNPVASALYFYTLRAENRVLRKKLLLMK